MCCVNISFRCISGSWFSRSIRSTGKIRKSDIVHNFRDFFWFGHIDLHVVLCSPKGTAILLVFYVILWLFEIYSSSSSSELDPDSSELDLSEKYFSTSVLRMRSPVPDPFTFERSFNEISFSIAYNLAA